MRLNDQVLAQALLLAGPLEERQQVMLGALCNAVTVSLSSRLREGLTPDDCRADFVASASLLALAALTAAAEDVPAEQITVGDFSVRKDGKTYDAAANCLRTQAEMMITPYLKDRFLFVGV